MSYYNNNTTKCTKNKHLTEKQRYTIEVLLKEGYEPIHIAKRVGKSIRTVEREIARGSIYLQNSDLTFRKEYCADVGQRRYEEGFANKGPALKIDNDHKLVGFIENKIINEKYSPDAVIAIIRENKDKFKTQICTKTLYNYIDKEYVFLNLTNKDLPVKKDGKKRSYKKVKIPHKNLKGTSIEERPEEVDTRESYGHWEMDCVVGNRGGSGATLLVLSERKIREEIIIKMKDRTQKSVIKALDVLERKLGSKFNQKFKTITVDNGTEFLDMKSIEKSAISKNKTRTKVFYCHPYSSWERGTNENLNKLIRRFIPKGTDIGKVSIKKVKYIQDWMNNYPRKLLGYKTPNHLIEAT
jgi:IS30 family transposase